MIGLVDGGTSGWLCELLYEVIRDFILGPACHHVHTVDPGDSGIAAIVLLLTQVIMTSPTGSCHPPLCCRGVLSGFVLCFPL